MSQKVRTHKDLEIWKKGIDLVTEVYKVTKQYPKEEQYGLCSQMQRAAVSYTSNIAEGAARSSVSEYVRYLYIAMGSLSELETQVIISVNLEYMDSGEDILEHIEHLRRMTLNFIKYLKDKS
ncbi:MAG: four helix bundle protein [Candidatus Omnitrophica bacterium]|nr:four helix bundle protein [Candidatus Omnitrophota bacterium]MCB9721572.1 four helix bundle protein [Candidatus Omnitrophota bacterium]